MHTPRWFLFLALSLTGLSHCSAHAQFRADSVYSDKVKYEFLKEFYNHSNTFYLLDFDSTRLGKVDSFDSGFFRIHFLENKISVQSPILLGLEEEESYSGRGALIGVGGGVVVALVEVLIHLHDPGDYTLLQGALFSLGFYGLPLVGIGALIGSAFSDNTIYLIGLLR
jgi:hypothetical protein